MTISLVYTFYNNQEALKRQCAVWKSYPDSVKSQLLIIIVDDGSTPFLRPSFPPDITSIHLRILEDIRWNQPGARNLAMKFVQTEWALITDSDHVVTTEAIQDVLSFTPVPGRLYQFGRMRAGERVNSHPNTFLLRKDDFFAIGGYDEDFCGNYGYDDLFFMEKAKRMFTLDLLDTITILNNSDFSTQGLDRNHRNNKKLLKKKRMRLERNKYSSPPMLRFNWEIVSINPPFVPMAQI